MSRGYHPGAVNSLWTLFTVSLAVGSVLVGLLVWDPSATNQTDHHDELFMYCAAGLRKPVDQIAEQYSQESFGKNIEFDYGGSNTLLSQIELRKVGDLFLAADDSYIQLAIEKGLVKESIPIAWQQPVIAVRKGNPKSIQTLSDVFRDDVRVAVANPDAAAVGHITRKLLQAAGRWDELAAHAVVFTPTVNEIANSVKVGSIDAGIIWDALAVQYPELEMIELPEFRKGKRQIVIGVLSSSKQPTAALRFARYLAARDKGLRVFRNRGYETFEGDIWETKPRLTIYSGGVNRIAIQKTLDNFILREGVEIDIDYNGCGILCAQMKGMRFGDQHGTFPDAYFACDISFMKQVNNLFFDSENVSETDMVIISKPGNPKNLWSLQDLTKPGLKLGLANPDQSALGGLTRRLLRELEIYESVEKNVATLVPTADLLVLQVREGELDAAIVYRANTSQVLEHLEVIRIEHPLAHAVQPYAVARTTDHGQTMKRLLAAIRAARGDFESAGFRYLAGTAAP